MRTGVVLGGGGVLGVAWETGVLAALADAGIDLVAPADVVVGTSAGSVVGSRLALGASVDELVAEQLDPGAAARSAPPSMEPDLEALGRVFGAWTAAESMTADVARACCAAALEARTPDEAAVLAFFREMIGDRVWPTTDLRVVSVACRTGERAVWTATSGVPLSRAVASSCAVPGMFPPITVDPSSPERYVDGGLWSGTSADLLLGTDLDAAVIVDALGTVRSPLGAFCARAVATEVEALEKDGVAVAVVSPGSEYAELGMELMNPALRAHAVDLGRADGAAATASIAAVLGRN